MDRQSLLAALLVLITMGACSGPEPKSTATSPTFNGVVIGEDPPPDQGGAASGTGSRKKASGAAKSTPTPHPLDPKITRNPDGSYDIPNAVKAHVPEEESWAGPTCRPPRPGSICWVPFQGAAYSRDDENVIVLLAYEDGASTPAASMNIPAKKGDNRIDYALQYTVGPNTKYVTFQVDLRDSSGKVLAQSFAQHWPLHY